MKSIAVTVSVREDVCWQGEWDYSKGCKPKVWPAPCPFMTVKEHGGTGDAGWKEYWCLLFGTKLKGCPSGIGRCEACVKAKV